MKWTRQSQETAKKAIAVEVSGYEARGRIIQQGVNNPRLSITHRYPSVIRNPGVDKRDIPREERVDAVTQVIRHLRLQEPDISYFGLASTGTVDPGMGTIIRDQCAFYQGTIWPEILADSQILRPDDMLLVQNDAKAGAWGEYCSWSHHPRYRNKAQPMTFVRVMVSSGVGSAIVHNGLLMNGSNHVAGEIPYMPFRPSGDLASYIPEVECGDGRTGCIESYAASRGILRGARRAITRQESDWARSVAQDRSLSLLDVEQGYRSNDPSMVGVLRCAAAALGSALLNIIYLVGPDVILVGGDVVEQLPPYFGLVAEYVKKYGAITPATNGIVFDRTQLGSDNAVAIGIADLAFDGAKYMRDY